MSIREELVRIAQDLITHCNCVVFTNGEEWYEIVDKSNEAQEESWVLEHRGIIFYDDTHHYFHF